MAQSPHLPGEEAAGTAMGGILWRAVCGEGALWKAGG